MVYIAITKLKFNFKIFNECGASSILICICDMGGAN